MKKHTIHILAIYILSSTLWISVYKPKTPLNIFFVISVCVSWGVIWYLINDANNTKLNTSVVEVAEKNKAYNNPQLERENIKPLLFSEYRIKNALFIQSDHKEVEQRYSISYITVKCYYTYIIACGLDTIKTYYFLEDLLNELDNNEDYDTQKLNKLIDEYIKNIL